MDLVTFKIFRFLQLEAADFDEEENSVEDFRNSLPHRPRYYSNGESSKPGNVIADDRGSAKAGGSDSKIVFNDILDHDASFKDDDIVNNLKKVEADVGNNKIEQSVVKSGTNPKVEPPQAEVENKNELNEAQIDSKPDLPQEAENSNQINEAQIDSKPDLPQEAESSNQINEAQVDSKPDLPQEAESSNQIKKAQIDNDSKPKSAQEVESQNKLSEIGGANREIELDSRLSLIQNDQEVSADGNTNPEELKDSESGNLGEGKYV